LSKKKKNHINFIIIVIFVEFLIIPPRRIEKQSPIRISPAHTRSKVKIGEYETQSRIEIFNHFGCRLIHFVS
jgi:hypothetical protein